MRLWPLKKNKTSEKTNQESITKDPILTPFTLNFSSFGTSSVDWIHVVGKKQNSKLLIDYFNQLSEVSAPIRKYADPASNINLFMVNDNGEKIENEGLKIAQKFWEDYSQMFVIYDLLTGNSYIQALSQLTVGNLENRVPTELTLLPSEFTEIILKQTNNLDFRNIEIEKYTVDLEDSKYKTVNIRAEDVLHIKTDNPFKDSSNNLYGISRLASAEKNLQSVASAYGARIALYDNGPRVVITGKNQGDFAAANEDEDVKDLQERINDRYGRTDGQYQVFLTKVPLDVSTISMNVKDLQLNEVNSADFRRICNVFNQDSKIHGDPEATTYDNMNTALTDFYINAFQPYINSRLELISKFLNEKGFEGTLKADYSGIKEIAEFEKKQAEELFLSVERGLITRNEYLEQIGQSTVSNPNFDKYMTFYNGQWFNIDGQIGNNQEPQTDNQELQGQES